MTSAEHLCIYHGNCADGFGAAWAVRKSYAAFSTAIRFHPGKYGDAPPDVERTHVVLVDFSYPRPVLLRLAEQAEHVTILDHHKTARDDLIDLPGNVEVLFDMERSGAGIAWDYFHSGPRPKLIDHVEDRDLWRFALPYTREIQAAVFSHPYDFAVWDALMEQDPQELIAEGRAIERKHHKDVAELLALTRARMIIGGYDVPVANLPYTLASDAGAVMAKGEPFAATYYDTPNARVYSLRSSAADGVDVSEIAKRYGGGGHRNAAGFRVPHGGIGGL